MSLHFHNFQPKKSSLDSGTFRVEQSKKHGGQIVTSDDFTCQRENSCSERISQHCKVNAEHGGDLNRIRAHIFG